MWDAHTKPKNLFTFASAGWVLLLTAAFGVLIVVITVVPAVRRVQERPPGDGRDPTTYGFDLSTCLVSRDVLVAGQLHRDMMPPLIDPPVRTGASIEAYNAEVRGKYVVPTDRVIGVALGGEARAYPLLIMGIHEVANDVLGGVPIAVTYNPLCDSVVVYDRRPVGAAAGEPLVFGVSGLLWSSNLLLYDRAAPGSESLWLQLQARAVTGPAARAELGLEVLPAVLTQWSDWLELHPETTVLDPDPALLGRYRETNYDRYLRSPEIMFPLSAAPPDDALALKTPCLVALTGSEERVYALEAIADRADGDGRWHDDVGGRRVDFRAMASPRTVRASAADNAPLVTIPCLWFAWRATHPEATVAVPAAEASP
jgi:hypothetical protein